LFRKAKVLEMVKYGPLSRRHALPHFHNILTSSYSGSVTMENQKFSIAFTAVLGIAVVLILPAVAVAFRLRPETFGALAGLTVYAVPQVLAATAPITFAPTLYELRLDDAGLELFRNGVSDGSTPVGARTNILNGVSLGYRNEGVINYYGFIGQVAEVLIYDRALSADERVQVESHLTNKWYSAAAAAVPVTRNLKFWVDASVTSSIVTAAGKVAIWKGQSESGYYVKQDNATMQPTYNPQGIKWHPSLSFNGTNVMSLPFTAINYSNHTVFVVAQAAEVVAASDFLSGGGAAVGGSGELLLMNYQNKFRGHYMPSTTPASWTTLDSSSAAVVKPVIYEQRLDNANLKIYRNGQLDGTSAAISFYTNVLRTVCLGSRSTGGGTNFKGEMSEVLVYDCALTDAERQQVEAYLYAKWLMERRGTQIRVQ